MHHGQLPRHRQHRTFTRRIRQLRRATPDQRHHTRRINHTSLGLVELAETQHGVLTSKPNTLDIDRLRQIPNLLGRVDGVGVVGVHDSCIVEDYVQAAPGVEMRDGGRDVGFLGYIGDFGFDFGSAVGVELFDFGQRSVQGGARDVG